MRQAGVVTSSCPSACPCLLPCLSAKAGPCHALCPFSPRRGWGSPFSVLCLRSVGSGPESWTTLSLLQVLPSDPLSEEPSLEWESVTEDATASSQVALDCWGGRSSSFPPRPGVDAGLGVAVEESSPLAGHSIVGPAWAPAWMSILPLVPLPPPFQVDGLLPLCWGER